MADLKRSAGTYRINDTVFPAPVSTRWEEQELGSALDGRSKLSQYKIHVWNFPTMESYYAILAFGLYDDQQSGTPITVLETDPYDATLSIEHYGTQTYTDVVITNISARVRGLPNYDDVSIIFEVLVT
jgi:hypothetical protein